MTFRTFLAAVGAAVWVTPGWAQVGKLEWQAWLPVGGAAVASAPELTAPLEQPAARWHYVQRFESARDLAQNLVVRIRGVLTAPVSGTFIFRLEVQGEAEVRLAPWSSDPPVAGRTPVIVKARDTVAFSDGIELVSGQRYFVEAVHRAGPGPDLMRVGWTLPDGTQEEAIPGRHFEALVAKAPIAAYNYRHARLEPYIRSYDPTGYLSRDRHNPRPGEHLTRETVYAAAAMLGSDRPDLWEEAARALARVMPFQEVDENAAAFGNFPRLIERPDDFSAQNIGGFIGGELILILQLYRDRLPPPLVSDLESVLKRTAERGRRYNPPVTASNIVTKAVAVGLLADEMLGAPAAGEWAARRLRELHAHTQQTGLPTEYNSPTYNGVVIKALSLLRAYLRNAELRPLVEDIYLATWRELALNYNPDLQLWTGAAARRYEDVFSPGALLQSATDNDLFFGEHSFSELPAPMPERFRPFFEPLARPVSRRFSVLAPRPAARIEDQQSPTPLVATVYHSPNFSLGSLNRADLWDQRRPLVAYWGKRDEAGFFRLTSPSQAAGLLAAQTHTLQSQGEAVVVVTFITDVGWGLPPYGLAKAERSVAPRVSDIRLRLMVGGPAATPWTAPEALRDPIRQAIPGGRIEVRLLHGDFGGVEPVWELSPEGHLDLVLHRGEDVDLARVTRASAVF